MDYCGPKGIPHSRFLGWTEDDQDKAIAWEIHRRSQCGSCGSNPDDWLDDDGYPVEPEPYTVDVIKCVGCQAIEEARQEIPSSVQSQFHIYLRPNR